LSIAFLRDEKPNVASLGSGRRRSDVSEVFVMAHFKRTHERPSDKKLLAHEREVNEGFADTA
jgi:hypothetical protein